MKLKNILSAAGSMVLGLVLIACETSKKQESSVDLAKESNDSTFDSRDEEKDADFVVNAVASNYAEIKLAQLANNKSQDPGVKEIAAKLEADHSELLKELKAYANEKGISVPLQESPEDSKAMADLESKDAKDFDKEWCSTLEDRHEKTISKFEKREDKTEDPQLRDWIATTLPELRSHLDMIDNHKEAAK